MSSTYSYSGTSFCKIEFYHENRNVREWCIVRYRIAALWDLLIMSIPLGTQTLLTQGILQIFNGRSLRRNVKLRQIGHWAQLERHKAFRNHVVGDVINFMMTPLFELYEHKMQIRRIEGQCVCSTVVSYLVMQLNSNHKPNLKNIIYHFVYNTMRVIGLSFWVTNLCLAHFVAFVNALL